MFAVVGLSLVAAPGSAPEVDAAAAVAVVGGGWLLRLRLPGLCIVGMLSCIMVLSVTNEVCFWVVRMLDSEKECGDMLLNASTTPVPVGMMEYTMRTNERRVDGGGSLW